VVALLPLGAPPTGDPRVHLRPVQRGGMIVLPLTRQVGGLQAYKLIITNARPAMAELRTHEGYDWIYVLSGRLRLLLGEQDLVLTPGEAAEFDTRIPHYFAGADDATVEVLSLFGHQGERAHLRARSPGTAS